MAHKFVTAACVAFGLATGANAAILTDTLGEVSFDGGPVFPEVEQIVGTFTFAIPLGDTVVSASIAGTFGNSQNPSSAPFDLFADGELIGQCIEGEPCFFGPATPFDFAISDLGLLSDGEVVLSFIQTGESIVRLGETTLTVVTEPSAVPLPASGLLLLAGAGGLVAARRRRKA